MRLERGRLGCRDQHGNGVPNRSTSGLAIGSSPTAAGISQKLPYELIGMVDNIGPAEDMIVRKAASIKKPADFKGKKVATPVRLDLAFPPARLLEGQQPDGKRM